MQPVDNLKWIMRMTFYDSNIWSRLWLYLTSLCFQLPGRLFQGNEIRNEMASAIRYIKLFFLPRELFKKVMPHFQYSHAQLMPSLIDIS